jgi:hypothetical protein
MSLKAIKTWEKEKGVIVTTVKDENAKVSEDDFNALLDDPKHKWLGVQYEQRLQFLKDNGYKPTRQNIADATLEVKSDNSNSAETQDDLG